MLLDYVSLNKLQLSTFPPQKNDFPMFMLTFQKLKVRLHTAQPLKLQNCLESEAPSQMYANTRQQ